MFTSMHFICLGAKWLKHSFNGYDQVTQTFHTSHQHIMLTLLFQYVTKTRIIPLPFFFSTSLQHDSTKHAFHMETTEEVTLLFSESQHKMSLTQSLCQGVLVPILIYSIILVALTKPARANPDCAFVSSAGRTHLPPTRQRHGVLGKGPTQPLLNRPDRSGPKWRNKRTAARQE